MTEKKSSVTTITLHKTGWIFGILFLLGGLGMFTTSFLAAICNLLAGFVLLPPSRKWVEQKINITLSKPLLIVIVCLLLLVASTGLPDYSNVQQSPKSGEKNNIKKENENNLTDSNVNNQKETAENITSDNKEKKQVESENEVQKENKNTEEVKEKEDKQEGVNLTDDVKSEIAEKIGNALNAAQDKAMEEAGADDLDLYQTTSGFDQEAYNAAIRKSSELEQQYYKEKLEEIAKEYGITTEEVERIFNEKYLY